MLVGRCAVAQVIPGPPVVAPNPPTSTITGSLQTATGGVVTNGTLTFSLSQPAVVSGTSSVSANTMSCYTSTAGNVVGVPDPLATPILSTNIISGTLPAGTYFVKFVYVGPGGTASIPSPEASAVLSAQGTLNVAAPAFQPSSATGFFAVYIGTTSGSETLQGAAASWTTFSQSTPLVAGGALPSSNNTACNVWFSDSLIPTGTYYTVNLTNKNGSVIAGFPQTWCTFGGAGATINVSQGAPTGNCGTNGVFYPTPIFAVPANGAQQSISGPMAFPGGIIGAPTFSGSPLFTGSPAITVTNPGLFDNSQYNIYDLLSIGGCNNQTLYSLINGGNETAGINSCITVPVGAIQRQNDAIAGMVDQHSGAGSPAVAIFGGAAGSSTNARAWGANFVFYDGGFATPSGYGVEIDHDVTNVGTIPHGLLVTGLWHAQATQGEAIAVAMNDITFHWPYGIRFFTGATIAVSNTTAAIQFDPVSAANNSPSQGLFFNAVPGGGGSVAATVNLLPNGNLDINNPSVNAKFSINGGAGLGTSNQTGTGSIVMATSPAIGTPTITSPTFSTGISGNGSGFKHQRFASPLGGTCPTGAAIGNACTSANLNWTTAFADNNYSVTCSLDAVTNQPHIVVVTKQAAGAGITITIATDLASAANAGAECIAVHD